MSEHVMDTALGAKKNWPTPTLKSLSIQKLDIFTPHVGPKKTKKPQLQAILILKKRLQKIMWQCVGIVRTKKLLTKAEKQLQTMQKQLSKIMQVRSKTSSIKTQSSSQTIIQALELQNMLQVAALIIKAALKRKKSLGAHYRKN